MNFTKKEKLLTFFVHLSFPIFVYLLLFVNVSAFTVAGILISLFEAFLIAIGVFACVLDIAFINKWLYLRKQNKLLKEKQQ